MNDKPCSRENAIAHAVSSNQWSEELRLHIAQCERCAEVGEVSLWMNRVAESWDTPEPICDPGLIWLKAQSEEEQRLRMMALRPVLITQAAVSAGLLLSILALIVYKWPAIENRIVLFLNWMSNVLILSPDAIGKLMPHLASPVLIVFCLSFGWFLVLPRLRRALL